ncbi:MAG TPA: phosphatase PAP2 family protein [Candidatus Dormibacteraeota bacterium]|nr:phosphatase PAP2 family protein [Candidatus Dormibacteraeota bacterium]
MNFSIRLKRYWISTAAIACFAAHGASAQERIESSSAAPPTVAALGPSEDVERTSTSKLDSPLPSSSAADEREVSWRKLPVNFLHDQKDMWLFPVQLAKGHHLLPTALIVGGTAALIAADPQVMPHFRQTDTFHDFNRAIGTTSTGAFVAVVPAAFYVTSLIRKDTYGQHTALFVGEALADDAVLMTALKAITRRQRPTEIALTGSYSDTFFNSNGSMFGKGTSFPSGHAMMAFSVATIFSRRYPQHRWLPYVAYGLASAIAFSRVSGGSHFPSDAFIGAALGYVVARFDVLHNH